MEIVNDKYGIPTTLRLPASIKQELQNQAVQRGLTLAEFLSTIILSHHTNTAKQDQEYNRVYKELQALTSVYNELQTKTKWVDETRKPILEILLKNEGILKEVYAQVKEEVFDKTLLVAKGFDFSHATHAASSAGRTYFGVFSMYYTLLKDNKVAIIVNNRSNDIN